jgi:hypothetical protein
MVVTTRCEQRRPEKQRNEVDAHGGHVPIAMSLRTAWPAPRMPIVVGNAAAIAKVRRLLRLLTLSSFISQLLPLPLRGTFLDVGEPSPDG